jgi:hypothetical protein
MANEEKMDILLSADIEDKATSKIAELYKETARLKHEQKGLDDQVKNGGMTIAEAGKRYALRAIGIKQTTAETVATTGQRIGGCRRSCRRKRVDRG